VKLSIIIPTLNEAATIGDVLTRLQPMRARGVEVIVVDADSIDATGEIAAPLVDYAIKSARGRATQMNAGANVASGDTLLFLHADSIVPANGDELIVRGLSNPRFVWGRFDIHIAGLHRMLPVIAWFMNQRSRMTGIATGDQGIFVTRAAFNAVGGFPAQPLMEDVAISARLRRVSSPVCLHARITTSGRRWETHGVWQTIFLMWRLRLNYFMGADPALLHDRYYGAVLNNGK
jgi:rSAM/selenodomain-associated transferase 2